MIPRQKKMLKTFFIVIGILWLAILTLDWVRLFIYQPGGQIQEYALSKLVKLIASFIVASFVWVYGRYAVCRKDHRLLLFIFSIIFLADIGFYLNNNIAGIILFAVAQLFFILRHLRGITSMHQRMPGKRNVVRIMAVLPVVALINYILIVTVFIPRSEHPLFGMVIGYSIFLCISVCAGFATLFIGILPRINAILVASGVCILYCGDVMVGLNLMLSADKALIISTSLTWTFYLPAIVLFSLSGLRWENEAISVASVE